MESFSEWIVDQTQFRGAAPGGGHGAYRQPDGLRRAQAVHPQYRPHRHRHLGKLRGYGTIREAIEDPLIRSKVRRAMEESGAVLVKRYGFDPRLHAAYIEKILARFANPYLVDEIDRVGRQPPAQAVGGDRLVKPLLGTLEYGLPSDHLQEGIAAALHYHNADDPQAVELQSPARGAGPGQALARVTGLDENSDVVRTMVARYNNLK